MFTIKCQRHHHNRGGGVYDESANQVWDTFEASNYRVTQFDNSVMIEFDGVRPDGLWVYRQEGIRLHPENVYRQIIVENAAGKTTEHYREWLMPVTPKDAAQEAVPQPLAA